MNRFAGTLLACTLCVAAAAEERPLLDPLFGTHAVLQRDRPIDVWGEAAAGEEVVVTLANSSATTRADPAGHWQLALPALPAGGPHTLSARTASRQQEAQDIRVGDVWLCSGQSNMAFSVRGAVNSRAEIAVSSNANIRQVTVPNVSSATIRASLEKAEWKVAAPETTPDFSATCYFFARELEARSHVPQGLVVSAWGGARIEPWISEATLRAAGGYEAPLAVLAEYRKDRTRAAALWGEMWQQWWLAQPQAPAGAKPWLEAKGGAPWLPAPAELTHWEEWGEPALSAYNGMVWYRTHVTLTAAQAKQAATLSLGPIDDFDLTWVNGRTIGSGAFEERKYPLPAKLLKPGDNLIVVNVLDTYANGGMYGPAAKRALQFADGSSIPLPGWEYQIAPAGMANPPRAPWEATAGGSMLYNAMIAPLGRFGLRGVVWYQGESNASVPDAKRYEGQLRTLMADWRRQFGASLPFLVVQLPDYGALAKMPVESGWALTREAVRRAVAADGNAGLAVTYDLGNRDDVHPTNKQEVGRRLARAARHVVFGESLSASGAQPKSARREGGSVVVSFGDFEGELVAYNAKDPSAFELCGSAAGTCKFVSARLTGGGTVTLDAAEVADPTRVRFCWADSPLCNLYDSTDLPVGPFELSVN